MSIRHKHIRNDRRKDNWFNRLINNLDPTRDARLLAFIAVVCAAIIWLSREQLRGEITNQWVDAFYGLCALVGLGGSVWALVDKFKSREAHLNEQEKPEDKG